MRYVGVQRPDNTFTRGIRNLRLSEDRTAPAANCESAELSLKYRDCYFQGAGEGERLRLSSNQETSVHLITRELQLYEDFQQASAEEKVSAKIGDFVSFTVKSAVKIVH